MPIMCSLPSGSAGEAFTDITFTIEGANQDKINIYDPNGIAVFSEPIQFGDSTNTEVTMSIPVSGGDYTFESLVAKATDDSGDNYSKTITLTNSTTNVKVYPTDVKLLSWYGNAIVGWDNYLSSFSSNPSYYSSMTRASVSGNGWDVSHTLSSKNMVSATTTNLIPTSEYGTMNCVVSATYSTSVLSGDIVGIALLPSATDVSTVTKNVTTYTNGNYQKLSADISSINTDLYGCMFSCNNNTHSGTLSGTIHAMWLE